jgi:hypothetical protein
VAFLSLSLKFNYVIVSLLLKLKTKKIEKIKNHLNEVLQINLKKRRIRHMIIPYSVHTLPAKYAYKNANTWLHGMDQYEAESV